MASVVELSTGTNVKLNLEKYIAVQTLSKNIIQEIQSKLHFGQSEIEIVNDCITYMTLHGVNEYWYHGVPALVAIGEHTRISQSGQQYQPSDTTIQYNDFVTIDLSPALEHHWGVFAKSFVIDNGCLALSEFKDPTIQSLKNVTDQLHQHLKDIVHPKITYHDIYTAMQHKLKELNALHLDFKNNFGHSIEFNLNDRIYITKDEKQNILNKNIFSFEPHISFKDCKWGYKDADIYYFDNNVNKLLRLSECQ